MSPRVQDPVQESRRGPVSPSVSVAPSSVFVVLIMAPAVWAVWLGFIVAACHVERNSGAAVSTIPAAYSRAAAHGAGQRRRRLGASGTRRIQEGSRGVVAQNAPAKLTRVQKLAFLPDGIKNSIASAAATAMAKFVLQPLDTIKTIQQARANTKLGPIAAAAEVVKQRGVGGLWSGIGISVRVVCSLHAASFLMSPP